MFRCVFFLFVRHSNNIRAAFVNAKKKQIITNKNTRCIYVYTYKPNNQQAYLFIHLQIVISRKSTLHWRWRKINMNKHPHRADTLVKKNDIIVGNGVITSNYHIIYDEQTNPLHRGMNICITKPHSFREAKKKLKFSVNFLSICLFVQTRANTYICNKLVLRFYFYFEIFTKKIFHCKRMSPFSTAHLNLNLRLHIIVVDSHSIFFCKWNDTVTSQVPYTLSKNRHVNIHQHPHFHLFYFPLFFWVSKKIVI